MAQTPYTDLTSQDILAAHISGLAHSINKIEQVLNMKTATVTGHQLNPVTDQQDITLRYRIYEGTIRNWTSFTVKRNGNTVDESEYVAQPAFGVIVFNTQQSPTDVITVDATYIDAGSTVIETLQSDIAAAEGDISTLSTNLSTIQASLTAVQAAAGFGHAPQLNPNKTMWLNVRPGKTVSDLIASENILMAAGTIDAYPIFIEQRTKITKMRVDVNAASPAATMILGIYTNVNAAPDQLLGQTAAFSITVGAQNVQNLQTPVILEPGMYWIVRYQSAGVRLDGHKWNNAVHITIAQPNASLMNGSGDVIGVRSANLGTGLTQLPATFPAVGTGASDSKYLARTDLGTMYALI
jgi:hypothetical protein